MAYVIWAFTYYRCKSTTCFNSML